MGVLGSASCIGTVACILFYVCCWEKHVGGHVCWNVGLVGCVEARVFLSGICNGRLVGLLDE